MKMRLSYRVLVLACAGAFLLATGAAANVLQNPGFESGDFAGWGTFGNVFVETDIPGEPGNIVPYEGDYLCKMYGNFWCDGCFNVSGIFQEFETCEGDEWCFSINSRNSPWDPMQSPNWVVQKITWFDATHTEMAGAVESTILDASSPTDQWFTNDVIIGVAPPGAVWMQALVLFLQPSMEGGSAQVDAACLLFLGGGSSATESTNWGQIKALYR
jgi:hypothetical protein